MPSPPPRWRRSPQAIAATLIATVLGAGCAADSRPSITGSAASTLSTSAPGSQSARSTATGAGPSASAPGAAAPSGASTSSGSSASITSSAPNGTPTPTGTPAPSDATGATVVPTALGGTALDGVREVFARLFGYGLADTEATCLAAKLPPSTIAALLDDHEVDPSDSQVAGVAVALASCEPLSYVNDQSQFLADRSGVSVEEGACLTHAADALATTHPAIAGVLLDDWAKVPEADRADLVAALTPCVGDTTARALTTAS